MARKIDDIINPKPPPPPELHGRIMKVLGQATGRGDALTFSEIFSRVDGVSRPGSALAMVAAVALDVLDHSAGGHEERKRECRGALDELMSVGHVVADKSGGETYYWLQRWA